MSNVNVDASELLFRVVFVGAGNVMFGSAEGPWDHSLRFERKLGSRLRIVALIDPDVARSERTLSQKRSPSQSDVVLAYKETAVFSSFQQFADASIDLDIHGFVVGTPPVHRGTTLQGRDLEVQIVTRFPGIPLLVEKPLAVPVNGEDDVQEVALVSKVINESKSVCSVAYMLRYLKAVQMMKQIIKENNLTVMATISRFACAYASIGKPDYWFKSLHGGPIMEQATHVCDLSRYFGGEVDIQSISASTIEWNEGPGKLSHIDKNCLEDEVLPDDKIPRGTAANWKFTNGGIGSLVHVVALHGDEYACDFEVIADGYVLRLTNPYVEPILFVRRPRSRKEEVFTFKDDDPYYTEISAFVNVSERLTGLASKGDIVDDAHILCNYEDALNTFKFTWEIRQASERAVRARAYA